MKNFNRKSLLVIACIALVLTITVGGTLAYLLATDGPITNIFNPAHVTCEVVENFTNGDTTKSNVQIKNTGNTTAFIRAVVVGNWVKDGKIVEAWPAENDLAINYNDTVNDTKTYWIENDGYWYYAKEVAANGGTTSNLFDSYTAPARYDGAHLELTIVSQAVQSQGGTSTSRAVDLAWPGNPIPEE